MTLHTTRKMVFWAPMAVLGFLLFIALGGLLVQLLWNWLLPPVFGLPAITLWQALGILLLSRILFGGFGGGHHRRWAGRGRIRRRVAERFADRVGERMDQMSPEERERVRQRLGERLGFDPAGDDARRE